VAPFPKDVKERLPQASRADSASYLSNVIEALNGLGSCGIFLLMCLICADVIGRYGFNSPISGVTEIVEMSIVAIVFLQLADATAHGRLTRADSLVDKLRIKRPEMARKIDGIAFLCGVVLMAILAYGVIPGVISDYRNGSYNGTVGIFTFPSWPVKAVAAAGSVLTGLQLLWMAANSLINHDPVFPSESRA